MTKFRILVVDDEPRQSELIRHLLEQTMRFVVRVENRSALALSVGREFRPHMVLLDMDMPGKDGGEVAREIRADPVLREVPILIVTSLLSSDETSGLETMSAGMRFLAKPVNPKILIDCVDRALAGALAGRSLPAGVTLPAGKGLSMDAEAGNR
jgi:two-component system sensor histidine kinase/response regulator